MKIINLINDSSYIKNVVNWLWSEWGTERNYNYWKSWVENSTFIDKIPQTFIALEAEEIIGTISIWRCDLQSRQDIFPWLGGLFVKEEYRKKGIGLELQKHAFKVTIDLGYTDIYMFTVLNDYFEKLGWKYMEDIPDENGNMVKLYRKDLYA